MDDTAVRKLILPSFVITILSAIFIFQLKNITDITFFKKKHVLVIGILSAPENFDKRLSIRNTWLQLLPEISGSYYFIMGNEICTVHPFDRVDPYSCIDSPYILPQNVSQNTEFTTIKMHSFESKDHIMEFIGFGFHVRRGISIRKIGILKSFLKAVKREFQVMLISAVNNDVLASVTFSPEMLTDSDSEFLTKNIKTVDLKENSEVFVKIEKNLDKQFYQSCSFTTWQFEPNVIYFTHLWEEDSSVSLPFTRNSCSFVFLTYTILDVKNVTQFVRNRERRQKEWNKFNKELSVRLEDESRTYKDLLFVDVIDVYRNLSKKMVEFYKKLVEIEYFHYILKADDDSFVDLLRVYNQLDSRAVDNGTVKVIKTSETETNAKRGSSKFWWWSYFKEHWKVQKTGKWREDYYQSALYPTFPCGGAYVINKAIVDYIVANAQNLHNFQGEDVSLGIWLSGLPVVSFKPPKKILSDSYKVEKVIKTKFGNSSDVNITKSDLCQWTCNNKRKHNLPLCNRVQLSVEDMHQTWLKFISSGFL